MSYKRIISFVLCLLMVASLAAVTVNAYVIFDHYHQFSEWEITVEPDCTNDGEKERVCSICGEVRTESIPSYGGHTDDDEDKVCDNCGNLLEGYKPLMPASPDEATKDEATADEATKDEATKDEEIPAEPSTKDEATADEATKDEATKDEATDDEQEPVNPSTPDENDPEEPATPDENNPATPDEMGILGDVNGDGVVNIKDATQIQKFAAKLVELTDAENVRADVNADATVNIKDATAIQKFAAKLDTGLPIGEAIK